MQNLCTTPKMRLEVYESLRARAVPLLCGGWRLVLDRAPRGAQLPASFLITTGSAAPGPAGDVTVGGGCGAFSAGGLAGPAASDMATFFSVTIAVKPAERRDGDQGGWIDEIKNAVKTYVNKTTTEGLLVQSVAGGCLTLRGAILFAEAHDRHNLQQYLRTRPVNSRLPLGAGEGEVTCAVSTGSKDARHAVYDTLRRMAAAGAAGQGKAGQPGESRTARPAARQRDAHSRRVGHRGSAGSAGGRRAATGRPLRIGSFRCSRRRAVRSLGGAARGSRSLQGVRGHDSRVRWRPRHCPLLPFRGSSQCLLRGVSSGLHSVGDMDGARALGPSAAHVRGPQAGPQPWTV
jgi:hypothetical protein